MKNNKGVTLVSLVVTIIVLVILAGVSINLVLGDNGIITKAKEAKENLELAKIEEEKELNELYTQLVSESSNLPYDSIAKLAEFKIAIAKAIDEAGGVKPDASAETSVFANNIKGIVKEVTKDATATTNDILLGKTAWANGNKLTGTMANNGALNSTLNAGGSFTIPAGYTSGGKVTANSLASQTSATATAAQILSGKTAWVNGNKLTGTMANNGALNSTLNAGGSFTIPAGYTSGGKVTANSLASQTSATATAAQILSGKTAWVNGKKITGTANLSSGVEELCFQASNSSKQRAISFKVSGKTCLTFELSNIYSNNNAGYYPSLDYVTIYNGKLSQEQNYHDVTTGLTEITTLTVREKTTIDASQYISSCTSGYMALVPTTTSSNEATCYINNITLK